MKNNNINDAQFVPTLQPFKGLKLKKKIFLLHLEPKIFPYCTRIVQSGNCKFFIKMYFSKSIK